MLLLDFEFGKVRTSRVLTTYMLTTAAQLILKKWKSYVPPDINDWLGKMRYIGLICKILAMCWIYIEWNAFLMFKYGKHGSPLLKEIVLKVL